MPYVLFLLICVIWSGRTVEIDERGRDRSGEQIEDDPERVRPQVFL